MRGKQAKKRDSRSATSGQLDLFARSPSSAASRQPDQPSGQLVAASAMPRVEQTTRSVVDPLVQFVLSAGRSRGRPEKVLSIDTAEATDQRRLLDVREAALRLGLSKSTLDKMRCSGRGPRFIRATDRAIRYDPADLQAFADERRRRSTTDLAGLLAE